MAESTWINKQGEALAQPQQSMWKLVALGLGLAAAVVFLIFNAINAGGTQLYLTVGEFYAKEADLDGRDLRVSGWVLQDTIQYTQIDARNSRLEFDIVDNLANPTQTLRIVALNEPKPDLLQGDAQALVEGRAENGVFMSNPGGLLLKCPTRYEAD